MTNFEYRQSNKNSNFIADFGVVNNYKSPTTKKKSNVPLPISFSEFISLIIYPPTIKLIEIIRET